jgi:hypothetical protein
LRHTILTMLFPLASPTSHTRQSARMVDVKSKLFAYSFTAAYDAHAIAWEFADMNSEYERQGFGKHGDLWQVGCNQ